MAIEITAADGPTTGQLLLALVMIAAVGGLWAVVRARQRFAGLDADRTEHLQTLLGQLAAQSPRKLIYDVEEVLEEPTRIRAEMRDAVTAVDGELAHDRTTPRQAATELKLAYRSGMASVTDRVPGLALRLWTIAGSTIVLGSIAVYSTAQWRAWLVGGEGDAGVVLGRLLQTGVDITISVAQTGGSAVQDGLASIPFAELIYVLVLRAVFQGGPLLWEHPLVAGGVIALVAVVFATLDRYLVTPAAEVEAFADEISPSLLDLLGRLVILWAVAITPALLARTGGAGTTSVPVFPNLATLGDAVGAGLALALLGFYGVRSLRALRWALTHRQHREWADDSRLVVLYLIATQTATAAAGLGVVLAVAYGGVAVSSGRLFAVLALLVIARPEIQAAVIVGGVVLVALAVYAGRAVWPDLAAALRDALSERTLRARLFGQGLPVAAMVVVFLIAQSVLTGPSGLGQAAVPAAAGVALAIGVIARTTYVLLRRARYRASLVDGVDRSPSRVRIHCYSLTDADGRAKPVVVVDGERHVHDDIDALVQEAYESAREVAQKEAIRPKVSTIHADHVFELGVVHVTTDQAVEEAVLDVLGEEEGTLTTAKKVRAEIQRATFGTLKNRGGRVRIDELENAVEDYPDRLVEVLWRQWETIGCAEGMLLRDGEYISYRESSRQRPTAPSTSSRSGRQSRHPVGSVTAAEEAADLF